MEDLGVTRLLSRQPAGMGKKGRQRLWGSDYRKRSMALIAALALAIAAPLALRHHRSITRTHPKQPPAPVQTALRSEPWKVLCFKHGPHPKAHRSAAVRSPRASYRTLHPVRILRLHRPVVSLAFSASGRMLASGSGDLDRDDDNQPAHETVAVWKCGSGDWRRLYQRRGGAVLAYSPDGRILASGNIEGKIDLCSSATGRVIHRLKQEYGILFLAFSPTGRCLVAGNTVPAHCGGMRPGEATLWDPVRLRRRCTLDNDFICDVAFSPDGRRLAVGDRANTLSFVDCATGKWKPKHIDCVHPEMSWEPCASIAFSPNGRTIASSCSMVQVWDIRTQRLKATLPMSQYTSTLAFAPDGRWLAGAGDDRVIIWDVRRRRVAYVLSTPRQHHTKETDSLNLDYMPPLSFSPDGRLLACGNEDGRIRIWRMP